MKKVLALILALIMICSTAAMLAYAETEEPAATDWKAVADSLGLTVTVPMADKAPVLDGVVSAGEYTQSVYNAPETILNYGDGTGEIQSGVTEYFAHDAEWVYYAIEVVQANDGRAFQWQYKPFNTFDIFHNGDDLTTYYYTRTSWQARYNPVYGEMYKWENVDYSGSWGPSINGNCVRVPVIYSTNDGTKTDELDCAAGKNTETNVKTYEVRLAKSYLAEVNGCTAAEINTLSYFTYFHSAAGVGHIWTEEDIAALTAAGAAFLPENGAGELGYKFIYLVDSYKNVTKEMGLHINVPYAEVSPVVDGTINEGEYTTSKVWAADEIKNPNAAVVDEGVTEYFAHDDEFIYYAIAMKQTPNNKAFQWQFKPHNSFAIYNAKEPDIDTTLFQRISWQMRMVSYEGEDLWCDALGSWAPAWNYSGGDWRLPVYNEDLFYAGSKNTETMMVNYEIKLAKAYVAELNECDVDDVNVISYFTYLHGPQLSPTHTAEGNQALLDLGATRADAGELFYFMVLQPSFEQLTEEFGTHVEVPYTYVAPTLDGIIGKNEYPASKVWTPEQIAGYNEELVGDGVTEYFAHDDNFIYYAAEFTQTASNKAFQWQFKPHNSFAIFNAKEPDIDTTLFQRISWQMRMVSYEGEDLWCDATGSWAPAWNYSGGDWRLPVYDQDLFYAGSKNADTNKVVYEIKLSKAYVAELNGCDVADVNVISYFTYFHSASFLGHNYTAEESAKLLEAGATRADTGNLYLFMVLGEHTAHQWQDGDITTAPTHTTEGERVVTCPCGETSTAAVPVVPHVWDDGVVTTEPGHGTEGVKTFTCECGATKTEAVAPTTEHEWDNGTVTTEPTHTTEGVKTFTCTVSGCTETKTEAIAVIPHEYDAGVVTTEPTHTAEGVKTFTCGCGHTYTEAIAKTTEHAHDAGVVTTEPTHTTEGVKTFTCACGDTYTEAVAKTTEHEWDDGVVTTEPTVDAEGVKTFTCACGETKTEAIAKLDPPATTTTTTAATTTAATTTAAPEATKGCKGSIAISALVIAPVLAGGAMLLKKKED